MTQYLLPFMFTPGPWFVPTSRSHRASDITIEARTQILNNPVYICRVYGDGGTIPFESASEEKQANARLIAAAPTLAHALRDILTSGGDKLRQDFPEEYAYAVNAIASIFGPQ